MALFSFVALDPATKKAVAINPLQPSNAWEEEKYAERQRIADERRARRRAGQTSSVPGQQPAPADATRQLLLEARRMMDMPSLVPGDAVLMGATHMQNCFVCQPQHRNMHGRVFGGFLMR